MLSGKKIILGISGGIAAYKSINLIRLFIKSGAEVKVVTTASALHFVTKISLESVSKNKVYTDVFDESNDYTTAHISLTDWGDIFVVAPATANIIGKFANGIADDALSTSLLAFNKDVYIAPAMNCKMWEHFSVQKNCCYLKANGVHFIEPEKGFLACGYEGKGRMAEPEAIHSILAQSFTSNNFSGKKVLVTAGPTYEAIDPVRFIGNHSSGLMGYSIAEAFAQRGATVYLVSGPTGLRVSHNNIEKIDIVSADEMQQACIKLFPQADITVMAAAVADYKPTEYNKKKIKKEKTNLSTLSLSRTPDILAQLGAMKSSQQILVGFALETDNETDNAKQKCVEKNLDFIVLNSLKDKGAGFGTKTNKIAIVDTSGTVETYALKHKKEVAADIVLQIGKRLNI